MLIAYEFDRVMLHQSLQSLNIIFFLHGFELQSEGKKHGSLHIHLLLACIFSSSNQHGRGSTTQETRLYVYNTNTHHIQIWAILLESDNGSDKRRRITNTKSKQVVFDITVQDATFQTLLKKLSC